MWHTTYDVLRWLYGITLFIGIPSFALGLIYDVNDWAGSLFFYRTSLVLLVVAFVLFLIGRVLYIRVLDME